MSREQLVLILHLTAIGVAAGLKAVVEELERPAVRPRPRKKVSTASR